MSDIHNETGLYRALVYALMDSKRYARSLERMVMRLQHRLITASARADCAESESAEMRELLAECLNLCALGDVDETTEAYGWGNWVARARKAARIEWTRLIGRVTSDSP